MYVYRVPHSGNILSDASPRPRSYAPLSNGSVSPPQIELEESEPRGKRWFYTPPGSREGSKAGYVVVATELDSLEHPVLHAAM